MTMTDAELGKAAFEGYCEAAFDEAAEESHAEWDALNEVAQRDWVAAGKAAVRAYRDAWPTSANLPEDLSVQTGDGTPYWVCGSCTTPYPGELERCPNCMGQTRRPYTQEDNPMPKNTVHGGPSIGPDDALRADALDPHADIETRRGAQDELINRNAELTDAELEAQSQPFATVDGDETDEEDSPSVGNSSSTSRKTPDESSLKNATDDQQPAQTTESRSATARTGSSTAPSTGGAGQASAKGKK